MSKDELINNIEETLVILENYRSFGPMVDDRISDFKKITKCIVEPTPEGIAEAKKAIAEMQRQIGPYRSMEPKISLTLDRLSEWFKEI